MLFVDLMVCESLANKTYMLLFVGNGKFNSREGMPLNWKVMCVSKFRYLWTFMM